MAHDRGGSSLYRPADGQQARSLFIQVINHGIDQRTNVTTILSWLGLPALEVDGWGYLFAHPDQFALKEDFKDKPN